MTNLKQHVKVGHEKFIKSFITDLEKNKDNIKEISFISYRYLDYILNEVITNNFKCPEYIIRDNGIGTFYNRMQLLKSIAYFENNKSVELEENVNYSNTIRNYFAHQRISDLLSETIPDKIQNDIKNMHYLIPRWEKPHKLVVNTLAEEFYIKSYFTVYFFFIFSESNGEYDKINLIMKEFRKIWLSLPSSTWTIPTLETIMLNINDK